jgi:hypothetical protein
VVTQTQAFTRPLTDLVSGHSPEQQEKFFEMLSKLIYDLNRHGALTVQRTCFSCRFYDKKPMGDYCMLLEKTLFAPDIRIDCPEFSLSG